MCANKNNRAIFIDRDGVVIEDCHLIKDKKEVILMEHIAPFISTFKKHGFKIFIVTNQTVVSRGILSLEETIQLNNYILDNIAKLDDNAIIDKTYICPHHPNATIAKYRQDCDCRKPKPGMLLEAAKEFEINLSKSFMLGDRTSDIVAGNLAGCTTIQVLSGQHTNAPIESNLEFSSKDQKPDHAVPNLVKAQELIQKIVGENND